MSVSFQTKNKHLMWRAGFGIDINNVEDIEKNKTNHIVNDLFDKITTTPHFIDVADESLKQLYKEITEAAPISLLENLKDKFTKEQRQQLAKQSRNDIRKLNLQWIDEMVHTNNPLQEKMSLFWLNHFSCREDNIFHQQNLLHTIRTNALGNFKDLLLGVSKSASMLAFLNNQQNKKQHPNENFAREVMELFTLGRGNYTEEDVKEAARAFTGWGFNYKGDFVVRKNQHDEGTKTILGKTGNFEGDEVLNILLEQKQTAVFITQKIYKYFVNDEVDTAKIKFLSTLFYNSNYNITALLKNIFTSNWFYEEKNIGAKIKSPIELLVGIQKQLPMQIDKPEVLLLLQKALGQVLFYPPNVAGWAGGKNWIDSSSLMLRLQVPRFIKDNDELSISTKPDDDIQMGMKEMNINKTAKEIGGKFRITAQINWDSFIKKFDAIKRENLLDTLKQTLLQSTVTINNNIVENNIDKSSREAYIKTATIALMSSPEYQLC